jgi:hypothetical protein
MKKRLNVRQPIADGSPDATKNVRPKIGAQVKIDMDRYVAEYPDMKLMVINDQDGDVQRWLDAGAEPIKAQIKGRKIYEGLNDRSENDWVKFVVGQNPDGSAMMAYGLMMDPDAYDAYKLAPARARQDNIKNAMYQGQSSETPESLEGGGNVGSYAPNLPTGEGKGYNEIRPK